MRVKWQVNEWSQPRSEKIKSFDATEYGWVLQDYLLCVNYFEENTGHTNGTFAEIYLFVQQAVTLDDEEICCCLSQGLKSYKLCTFSIKCKNPKIISDGTEILDESIIED